MNKELLRKLYKLWTYYPHVSFGKLLTILGNDKPLNYNTDDMLLSKLEAKLSFNSCCGKNMGLEKTEK